MKNHQAELAKYAFMGWLDEFIIRLRKMRLNIDFIKTNESPVLLTSREEESDIEDKSNDHQDNDSCSDSLFDQQGAENSAIEIASKKA